jgi:hypothetical protein
MMLNIISLGAGVQSSTMALMAAHGEITPMPDCAIFADTQAEPKSVYVWLDWLVKQLPFPVYRITAGSLREESLKLRHSNKTRGAVYMRGAIPAFTKHEDGGKRGFLHRQCTAEFKIRPLTKFMRGLCDWKRGEQRKLVIKWIGISMDEAHRMKPSREEWSDHRYPLVEANITRGGCLQWMEINGYPTPPRSACTFCPFHSDQEWQRLKTEEPEAFADAVNYEKRMHEATKQQNVLRGTPFLHASCKPIGEVDFSTDAENSGQLSLFGNECEGICGV